jgi:hypothetical protein
MRVVRQVLIPVVSLTFCISAAHSQSGMNGRVEQNNPVVVYSGNWYANTSGSNSGGSAALTNAGGARASITFTGTGITWLGVQDQWCGFAKVYLDGAPYEVDTYATTTVYQQPIMSFKGLAYGTHTLTIEVQHLRRVEAPGSWVWIDAFEIENGSVPPGATTALPGRTEERNSASIYTGTWNPNSSSAHSGGAATLAMEPGSGVTITFDGTGIAWLGYRDEWSGIANVYVDGAFKATIDTYLSSARAQTTLYSIADLAPGVHTFTIEVTGKQNPSALAAWVWVDAFDVSGSGGGGPNWLEQDSTAIRYSGTWSPLVDPWNYGGSATLARQAGATAVVTFTGTGIRWIGGRNEWAGIAKITVDGGPSELVDLYLAPGLAATELTIWESRALAPGTHTLTIEATGTANAQSGSSWIWIDAFELKP